MNIGILCVCVFIFNFYRICIIYIGYVSLSPMSSLVLHSSPKVDAFVAGPSDRLICRGEFGPISDLWTCDQSEPGTETGSVRVFFEFTLNM